VTSLIISCALRRQYRFLGDQKKRIGSFWMFAASMDAENYNRAALAERDFVQIPSAALISILVYGGDDTTY
jgi:hypothetical protein